MNVHDLILQTKDNPDLLTIEATVITGFEFLAQDECREKCKPSSVVKTKGRIFFNIPVADFNKVLTLRSVDNVFLVTETIKEIHFDDNKDNDLNIVKSFVEIVDWEKSLNKWQSISGFEGIIYPLKNKIVKSLEEESLEAVNENKPAEIENISANSNTETENKKCADTDIVVESLMPTCVSVNQVKSDYVEFKDISKTDLNVDSIKLEDNTCASSSVNNIVCDLVSKIDVHNEESDSVSNDHKEEISHIVTVEEVDDVTVQDASNGNDIKHPEKCSPNLTGSHTSNEKRQFRGRNVQRDNNGKPRGKRLNRLKKNEANSGVLRFRATCYRVGAKHSFSSMEAACEFGGTLQDKFGWTVNLTQFDLNVILNIEKNQAYICIALTEESLHRRNITHFSNTTLRATMCYNLFRLAEPMTGEIVIDPLCGGGSIPIEGSLSFPNTYHICGDYNDKAVERTRANINHICKTKPELKVGAIKWNAKFLPLRCQSVDVLVSDLPFGRRSGLKQDNQKLYSSILFELAKVIRTGTGRACLLTYDRTALTRALRSQNTYWREIRQFGVNQGGLFSTVFLLLRRATPVPERTDAAEDIILKTDTDMATDKSEVLKCNELEDNVTLSVEVKENQQFSTGENVLALEEKSITENINSNVITQSENTKKSSENSAIAQSLPCDGKTAEDSLVLSVELSLENRHCSGNVDQLSNDDENVIETVQKNVSN